MFAPFLQVFVFYYGMFCDCITSGQNVLSLKLLYVTQTFKDTIYQFVACKNRVLSAFNSDNQRKKLITYIFSLLPSAQAISSSPSESVSVISGSSMTAVRLAFEAMTLKTPLASSQFFN